MDTIFLEEFTEHIIYVCTVNKWSSIEEVNQWIDEIIDEEINDDLTSLIEWLNDDNDALEYAYIAWTKHRGQFVDLEELLLTAQRVKCYKAFKSLDKNDLIESIQYNIECNEKNIW